jgi:hypothetical protein
MPASVVRFFPGPLTAEGRLSAHLIDEGLQSGFDRVGNVHVPPEVVGPSPRMADAFCDFMCAAEHLVEVASYSLAEHDVGEVLCLGDARDRFGREGLVLSEIG